MNLDLLAQWIEEWGVVLVIGRRGGVWIIDATAPSIVHPIQAQASTMDLALMSLWEQWLQQQDETNPLK